MKINIDKLIPSKPELWLCFFLAFVVGLLSNLKIILASQGLTSAVNSISTSASQTIGSGLATLDKYEFTNTAVTFGVWAIAGLLTLSLLQAFGHVIHEFNEEKELSSNAYIHPSNFTRKGFWGAIILTTLGSFGVGMLSISYILVFCLYLLPLSSKYIAAYVSAFMTRDLPYFLLGITLLFVGFVGLNIVARLIRFRHQLTVK